MSHDNHRKKQTMKKVSFLGSYIAAIVAANAMTNALGLVSVLGLTVTAGTFVAGAALIIRDGVQNVGGKTFVFIAVGVGAILSAATSNPHLALASGLAFAASEIVDFAVYSPLRKRNMPLAILSSSIVAAPIDTVLFLHLAGFGLTGAAIVGQFVIKTALAAAVAGGLAWRFTSRGV